MKHLPENHERHRKITHLGPNIETTLPVLEPSLDDTAEHLSLEHTEHEIEIPGEVQERVTHQSKKAYADMRELLSAPKEHWKDEWREKAYLHNQEIKHRENKAKEKADRAKPEYQQKSHDAHLTARAKEAARLQDTLDWTAKTEAMMPKATDKKTPKPWYKKLWGFLTK